MQNVDPHQLRSETQRLYRQGQRIQALQQLDQLIAIDAADAEDWCLTGRLLGELGEFAQAVGAFENCIERDARHVEARYELGRSLYKLGNTDRAAAWIEPIAEEFDQLGMWQNLATIAPAVGSFSHQCVRRIREKFAAATRQAESPQITQRRQMSRRKSSSSSLKLGYISAHWHEANYMKPVWPLINAHDRNKFEIHLFDDGAANPRPWHWLTGETHTHTTFGMSNLNAAELIQDQRLDVLIDLSAYSKPERLGMFVHRPAPIQIAWFNMYATSGFREFDYLIGDRWVIKSEEQKFYTEHCLQLPMSYLTFRTNHPVPDVIDRLPDDSEPFTFGCLGTMYKITPAVVEAWAEILCQAGSTQLVLSNRELKSLCNQDFLLQQFDRLGVAKERIQFLPPVQHYEYLKYYDRIDVALDTFPYNGGTTTMEAIWQGVPVLTFNGDRWASRTSRSILANSHLSQFVVEDRHQYVHMAVKLATDGPCRATLRALRQTMREQLLGARVCDVELFARKMESLYRKAFASL